MIVPFPNSYWVVASKLLAGEYPGGQHEADDRQRLQQMVDAGITFFVDLTRRGEMRPYKPVLQQLAEESGQAIGWQRYAIGDFGIPTREQMMRVLDAIDSELAGGGAVYVHCRAGIGRTGTVVGCHLVRHGLTGEQALQKITILRQGVPDFYYRSPESDAQCRFVQEWID